MKASCFSPSFLFDVLMSSPTHFTSSQHITSRFNQLYTDSVRNIQIVGAYNTEMALIPQPQPQNIRSTALTQPAGGNVVIKQLREVFRDAFDQLGGAAWLVEFVKEDPANARVFISAISKLLPATVQVSGNIVIQATALDEEL